MKKILSILLVLVFALTSFVSCDKIPGLDKVSDKLNFQEILNKVKFWEKDETPSVTLDDAKAYLFNTYKDSAKAPVVDYDLVAVVTIEGVKFSVTWTVDASEITIKESSKANFWTVDLPETNSAEKTYTLTATISDAAGNKVEIKFSKTLPVIDNSGIVTDPVENVAYKLFVNQLTFNPDGYRLFAKNVASTDENKFVKTTTNPLEAAEFFAEVVNGGYKFYTMIDGAKMYLDARTVTKEDGNISKYLGFYAEGQAVFTYQSDIQTFVTTIDGLQYGIGTYGSYDTLSLSEIKHFTPEKINVAGGQYPVTIMTAAYADTLTPSQKPENKDPAADSTLTIAQALELANTKVKDQYTEGKYYVTGTVKEVTNPTYGNMVITDGTNEITVYGSYDATGANRYDAMTTKPVAGDTVTVYGIIGMYNAPQIKNGWITSHTPAQGGGTVTPDPTPDPTPAVELEVVDVPVAGVAYKLGLFHGGNGNVDVFFNGQNYNNYAWYLAYGDAAAAVDVYLEAVEGVDGAYRLYFMNGEAKTYIRMFPRDGDTTKGTMEMTTTVPTEYFTYNTEYKTLIYTSTTGEQFYMGSSGTYKSISTSAISYITEATSYIAHFYAEKVAHTCEFVAGEVTAPTCTEAGYTTYTCTCGKTENRDEVAALGHTWADATCTAPKTCTVCQATEGEPAAHTYTANVTAPTCTQAGFTTYTCTCGANYTEAGDAATGHDFTNGDTCANGCGTTQDHVCNFVATEKVVAPTCTEAGYTVYACTCGKTENRDPVDALGHAWDNGTVTDPTCTEAGFTTFTCGTCQTTKTENPVAAPGHSWTDPTCTAPKTCSVCQATEGEALGHAWDNGTVTAPTCSAAGYTTFTCGTCQTTKTEAGEAATGLHADENGDCFCDDCNTVCNYGTLEAPLTATQAQAIGASLASGAYTAQKVYVTGIVTGIGTTGSYYQNVYISDGTTQFLIYSINFSGDITSFGKGDTITAYGFITNYNGKTPEMTKKDTDYAYVVAATTHTCEFSTPTCKKLATCVLCDRTQGDFAEHSYEDSKCIWCGHEEGTAELVTTTVTAKYTAGSTTNMTVGTSGNAAKLNLDANIFTVNAQKGGNNNCVGLNKDGTTRLYAGASGKNGNGNTLTVTATGKTIVSIKITFSGTNGGCQVSVDGEVIGTTTAANTTVEFDINAESFELKNICSSSTQIHIKSIEIIYA